jgi:hypothetical protein
MGVRLRVVVCVRLESRWRNGEMGDMGEMCEMCEICAARVEMREKDGEIERQRECVRLESRRGERSGALMLRRQWEVEWVWG